MIDSLTNTASSGLWYKPDMQKPTVTSEADDTAPSASGAVPTQQTDAAAQSQAGAQKDGQASGDGEEQSLLERILEVGFRAYAEQIRQEKIQELREKLLEAMGLTEEDLEKMPPEERANVEKLIANEIAKRMAAQAELNGGEDSAKSMQMTYVHSHTTTVTSTHLEVTGVGLGLGTGALLDPGEGGVGLGPLLALQEQDAAENGVERLTGERGKNDRVDV